MEVFSLPSFKPHERTVIKSNTNRISTSAHVLHIRNILKLLHTFYDYFDASCSFRHTRYPADASPPIPNIIRLISDCAAPCSCCFSFGCSHTEVCDLSLTGTLLERIMTSGEGEAAGTDEMFRSDSRVCVETFVRSILETRKKREKMVESTIRLELSPWIVFQVCQEASGCETPNTVTFYSPKYITGEITIGSRHTSLN